jgi:hypothetical protein
MKKNEKDNYDRQAIEINRMRGRLQDEEFSRRRALANSMKNKNL